MSEENLSAFKVKLRNLLVEYGIEPFVVVGFRNQEEMVFWHARGSMDLRSINALYDECYNEWFNPPEVDFEPDGEWWEDDE